MLWAIVAILLTLLLVIGIHEFGHALAARLFNVKIKKISIGFGKPLLSWQSKSGCEWVWAFFPLGGYVQLQNTRISPVPLEEYSHCFDKKPVWQRIVILLAGALANLVTAWVALIFVFMIGFKYTVPQVHTVEPNSAAAAAGMVAGDQLVTIAGKRTLSWQDVGMQLVSLWGAKEVPATISRGAGKELKETTLDLSQIKFHGFKTSLLTLLGMKPDLDAPKEIQRFTSLGEAIQHSNALIMTTLYFFLMIFKQLFSGVIPFSMLIGPLSIFAASVSSFTQGLAVFLYFIATLSLAVGFVNLLPVPGLDGGSIVYALIEKIRGKPVSVAMELLLHRLVFILFCVVLVNLLMNDLQRL